MSASNRQSSKSHDLISVGDVPLKYDHGHIRVIEMSNCFVKYFDDDDDGVPSVCVTWIDAVQYFVRVDMLYSDKQCKNKARKIVGGQYCCAKKLQPQSLDDEKPWSTDDEAPAETAASNPCSPSTRHQSTRQDSHPSPQPSCSHDEGGEALVHENFEKETFIEAFRAIFGNAPSVFVFSSLTPYQYQGIYETIKAKVAAIGSIKKTRTLYSAC